MEAHNFAKSQNHTIKIHSKAFLDDAKASRLLGITVDLL